MYQKWPSKPSILSRVSPGHLYYLFLDISPTYFSKIFRTKKTSRIENLEIWKSKNPGSLTGAQLIMAFGNMFLMLWEIEILCHLLE